MSSGIREPSGVRAPVRLEPRQDVLAREGVADIQRARILSAMAEEVSVSHEIGSVTVAQIVARSGVSRRTFYEIFDNCEDCFLATFDDGIERATRCVLDAHRPEASWVERIRMALTALLSLFDRDRCLGHLLVVGSLGGGAKALERRQRVLAQLVSVFEEGHDKDGGRSELTSLTAEGVLGGALSVLHSRMLQRDGNLVELAAPLTSMIVLPYSGRAVACRELERSVPRGDTASPRLAVKPLRTLGMRLTYRTVQVLRALAATPGASNHTVSLASGVADQGQMSKLLARLERLGLVRNTGAGRASGAPNAWTLTDKGVEVEQMLRVETIPGSAR